MVDDRGFAGDGVVVAGVVVAAVMAVSPVPLFKAFAGEGCSKLDDSLVACCANGAVFSIVVNMFLVEVGAVSAVVSGLLECMYHHIAVQPIHMANIK